MRETGRPANVYGKPVSPFLIEHEVYVTEAEMLTQTFKRWVTVGTAEPDGLFEFRGVSFAVEVDNHHLTASQMREKWERYKGFRGFILIVCHTKGRLRQLMRGASLVKDIALFSLFKWLRFKHVDRPWIDLRGKRSSPCTPERVGKGGR